ncbi:MAG: phosphate ABC transporter permease subunit PstC [Planctomycetia bacterium]|nr:phosphate ABC transporter permease subunit PstC [Planctomycetia bacterium]
MKQKSDVIFYWLTLMSASLIGLLMVGFFVQMLFSSHAAWAKFGLGFLTSSEWDPVKEDFGALSCILGTLITTLIALAIAVPLAFVSALFIVDAPPFLGRILSQAIDLLAAIPSVIYGMWGLFVLCPIMQSLFQPIFPDYNGFGYLTAGLILSLMILPYICAVMRDVFRMTPPMLRESAFGLGCTRWETARDIVLRYGLRGVLGGIFVGLGRALGETMAVLFVIGNVMKAPESLMSSGATIAATLANNFAEAEGVQKSALFALGLILLAMSFGIQIVAQYYLSRTGERRS